MKKYLILLSSVLVISCASDERYEDLNRDPNNPTQVSADALFTASAKSLFDQMESTNVNTNVYRLFAQYWTETTYIDESNYDLNTRNIPASHFSEMYRDVLYDLKDAKLKADTDNKKAMISVLEVYTWQQLVDTFGNIPYSEGLKGSESPTPVYDDAQTIYEDLFGRINEAIGMFSVSGASGFSSADIIYGGDINQWIKFANSVKLKLAMRVADVPALSTLAQTNAVAAVTAGVFTSNADNATIAYETSPPNTNPLWVDLVQSGRSDFVIANTIVDYMNTLSDPRRAFYFDDNLGAGTYVGGPYGDNNSFPSYTHIGPMIQEPDFRGVILDYAEVEFLLAEAVERGYAVGGTAETHYNNGITASMEDWGVASGDITTYLANPAVAYSTATGTWREKIGFQFWLAMYNRGFEGWCIYRKYDAPVMNTAAVSLLPVPKRYTYPLSEQTLNLTNYTAAASAIGGDELATPIFWDVN
ncbi:MAG: SusD/RagB family nutrient-binding outer membrane lipoprotein [Flavobacterium sp.]|uniref:SusD/RagB family nutrient-binding outer membrane lipoprotein n=1 Tax=unclassified Flavobacterium TaxID=196869 RepID=UPI000C3B9690|nr:MULTISPECIES: SusD/RagB family nutrient-binding outer membrane lipoprotein [unclassified Flavobacterium]MBF01968.1 SusD/RagB family nutrient-binding outer membrane lipoprotein [Flavobacterium sp.]MCO6164295.1 SusD/RagB family nutrient-binding outer membrane lipoprotein [Flavobacterium sp. NRK F7]